MAAALPIALYRRLIALGPSSVSCCSPAFLAAPHRSFSNFSLSEDKPSLTPPPVLHPFSRLPAPPPLLELLNTAVTRANKHRIPVSLRASSPPPPSRSPCSSSPRRRSSFSSPIARNTWKIRSLAAAQLRAIHDSIVLPITRFLFAFPPLSRLHPFDRAVLRLSLQGGEREYVEVLRAMRKLLARVEAAYAIAVKEVSDSHIDRRVPLPAVALASLASLPSLASSFSEPTAPSSRDLDSLLCYHRHRLLHIALSASTSYVSLLRLTSALSRLPLIDRELTVLIMGMPNVGKSSLLRAISSGKPEVQNYPFTTRGLVVGHMLMTEEEEREVGGGEPTLEVNERPDEEDKRDRKGSVDRSARRRRFARASGDDDVESVRLHEHRSASTSRLRSLQQQQRQEADLLGSIASSSPSLRVQLIDTPGLLFRPDSHRKAIELLTLTALHYLPLQLVVFVMDETGGCGWGMEEQKGLRREVRMRYAQRLKSGEVGWIDVMSKSDVKEKLPVQAPLWEEGEGEGEEEKARKRREVEAHRRLYAEEGEEGQDGENAIRVSVEVSDGSVSRLQRAIKAELRGQMRKLRSQQRETGMESREEEFRRTFEMEKRGTSADVRRMDERESEGSSAFMISNP